MYRTCYFNNPKYFKFMTIYPFLAFQETGKKSNIEKKIVSHWYNDGRFKSALGIKGGSRKQFKI